MIYPVITLKQPWATMVALQIKTIETRTHTKFQKLQGHNILIHAGGTNDGSLEANPYLTPLEKLLVKKHLSYGVLLCSAFVSDFRQLSKSDEPEACIECTDTPRYGLVLTRVNPFFNYNVKGSLNIWGWNSLTNSKVQSVKL